MIYLVMHRNVEQDQDGEAALDGAEADAQCGAEAQEAVIIGARAALGRDGEAAGNFTIEEI